MIGFFAEIVVKCEVKPYEDIKAFTLKALVKMYIHVCSFSIVGDIVQLQTF